MLSISTVGIYANLGLNKGVASFGPSQITGVIHYGTKVGPNDTTVFEGLKAPERLDDLLVHKSVED